MQSSMRRHRLVVVGFAKGRAASVGRSLRKLPASWSSFATYEATSLCMSVGADLRSRRSFRRPSAWLKQTARQFMPHGLALAMMLSSRPWRCLMKNCRHGRRCGAGVAVENWPCRDRVRDRLQTFNIRLAVCACVGLVAPRATSLGCTRYRPVFDCCGTQKTTTTTTPTTTSHQPVAILAQVDGRLAVGEG